MVNSFHRDVIEKEAMSPYFRAIAMHKNNNHVEAMHGITERILGIQWHPERMNKDEPGRIYTNNLVRTLTFWR